MIDKTKDECIYVMCSRRFVVYNGSECMILSNNNDQTTTLVTNIEDYIVNGSDTKFKTTVDTSLLDDIYYYQLSATYGGIEFTDINWTHGLEYAFLHVNDSDVNYDDPRLKQLGFRFIPSDYEYSKEVKKAELQNLQLNIVYVKNNKKVL